MALSERGDLSATLQRYELNESEVTKSVSPIHLQQISRSRCRKWRLLPAALGMENDHIWEDIQREVDDEEGRRNTFFSRWQSEKGSDANYKSLINALLRIGCKQDAEFVCGLMSNVNSKSEGELKASRMKLS